MKNFNIKLVALTLVVAGFVMAQPKTPAPRVELLLPPSDRMVLDLERLEAPLLSGEMSSLGDRLVELSGSLHALSLANVDMAHAEVALAGVPMPTIPPGLELLGNVEFNLDVLREGVVIVDDSPQQDPGYQAYKDGYNLVLQEKWAEARKMLEDVAKKFPSSRYVDDAQYWIAFSWMKDQPKKAAQLYREFFAKYPTSNYFDDAVADLGKLEGKAAADSARAARVEYEAKSFSKASPVIAVAPGVSAISVSPNGSAVVVPPGAQYIVEDTNSDPDLKIKKNAIEALRRNPDEKAFTTISDIAGDSKQHRELRKTALYALEKFDSEKVLPVYLKIAQSDSDLSMRKDAIYYIGRLAKKDDARALQLIRQYALDSSQPKELRESAMYALKESKNGNVLELYLQIAKGDNNRDIRKTALYYIGQLARNNDERATSVLREYALDRNQDREVRESALYSLKEINGGNPLAIYLEIVKNDPDDRLRRTALYYIGQLAKSNDEKAYQVLKEYAVDQKQDPELRETAMHSLRELRRTDVLPTLMEIAKTDPSERVRKSAIYQVGEMRRYGADVSKFLIDLAKDQKQPREIRKSAIYGLRDFTDFDVYAFYVDLAKNDPDREIQQSAIYYISHSKKNKAESMELLVKLFDQLPADRTHAQESCLYGIADVGGDKAVDFLIKVAKTHKNYEMRQKAVYYLGNIGGDKARSALLEILQGK